MESWNHGNVIQCRERESESHTIFQKSVALSILNFSSNDRIVIEIDHLRKFDGIFDDTPGHAVNNTLRS